MTNQLINKYIELNDCVNNRFAARASPRHSLELACRFGSQSDRRESRGERRGEWRVNRLPIRHAPRLATRAKV